MSNSNKNDWFGARGRGASQGWPGNQLWDAMDQLRGSFDQKVGPRMGRGDVRSAVIALLAEKPMHGYQIINEIAERSGGMWKPSPGSVYPTVQQLEDEGLVEGREVEGRRLLRLTDDGRHYVEEHAEEMAATWRPFEEASSHERTAADDMGDLMPVTTQVMSAMWQIMTTGTSQQRAEATEILSETRRKLYGLLAEGDPKGSSE